MDFRKYTISKYYDGDYIVFRGERYPCRTLVETSEDGREWGLLVSVYELEKELMDDQLSSGKDTECDALDGQIAYYANAEEFSLPDKDLYRIIYH